MSKQRTAGRRQIIVRALVRDETSSCISNLRRDEMEEDDIMLMARCLLGASQKEMQVLYARRGDCPQHDFTTQLYTFITLLVPTSFKIGLYESVVLLL